MLGLLRSLGLETVAAVADGLLFKVSSPFSWSGPVSALPVAFLPLFLLPYLFGLPADLSAIEPSGLLTKIGTAPAAISAPPWPRPAGAWAARAARRLDRDHAGQEHGRARRHRGGEPHPVPARGCLRPLLRRRLAHRSDHTRGLRARQHAAWPGARPAALGGGGRGPDLRPRGDASGMAADRRPHTTHGEVSTVSLGIVGLGRRIGPARGGRERVEARCEGPSNLVRRELHFPGWRAVVNRDAAPLHREAPLFQGVRLDAGMSDVQFIYKPPAYRLAAAVFVLGLVALLPPRWRRAGAARFRRRVLDRQ